MTLACDIEDRLVQFGYDLVEGPSRWLSQRQERRIEP